MTDESLGARIRRLRNTRGMTQDQLAEACLQYGRQVSRSMVNHWEHDQHAPTLVNFAAMARVFCVSMDVLFYGEEGAGAAEVSVTGA
jgi:transcriptional regulator with XRE-family HTH domain